MHRKREEALRAAAVTSSTKDASLSRAEISALAERAASKALKAFQQSQKRQPERRRLPKSGKTGASKLAGAKTGPKRSGRPRATTGDSESLTAAVRRAWAAVEAADGCLRDLGGKAAAAESDAVKLRSVLSLLREMDS
jgi:hypothetical protein